MARFCASCGAQVADGAGFCPACGKAVGQSVGTGYAAAPAPASGAAPATGGLADNVAGMLAYITFIPAIIFLVMEPYNKKPFVRFHAFQCLFFSVALFVVHIVLMFVPLIGWAISALVSLGALVLWVVCLIKANQGQWFKIPVIGDIAEKQANAM
jgi:uncharacterized membrane protein